MKKVTIQKASRVEMMNVPSDLTKMAYAEGDNLIVSDGYHTFDELYDHRMTLFIALGRMIALMCSYLHPSQEDKRIPVWRSKLHSDLLTMYPGMFIMGIGKAKGEQMTYHLPIERWDETNFAETLEAAPEFDGHTPDDVIARLKKL